MRTAVLPLAVAVVAALSLVYPLAAPIIAVGGGVVAFLNARKTAAGVAWFALAVCAAVLVASLVIDFGLLAASSAQIGPVKTVTGAP